MSELYDQNLTQWLQLSGEYIGRVRPANERTDWIMFLFEQIEPFVPPAEFEPFLAEVQKRISAKRAELSS